MNAGQRGKWFRSESFAYALGTPYNVKLDFLAPARQMEAPEIAEIVFRFTGTVGAVNGGALGRDAAKLFDQIVFRDDEEMINASGAGLRCLEQMERGNKQIDPADISSGATNTTYNYKLHIVLNPDNRAVRGRDMRVPLAHFLEGGNLTFQTPAALPTGWAAVQADQRVIVMVKCYDGRKRELKSRRRIIEQQVSSQEFDYQVNGSLRAAILFSKLTTTGHTTLAPYTTIYSRTLELPPQFQTDMLVDEYRTSAEALGTNDEFTLAAPGAIPLCVPGKWGKTGQMIDTKILHIDLGAAAPTGGRLLTDVITDRSPAMAALSEGYESPGALAAAVKERGQVVGEGGNIKVTHMVNTLARRMPVRIG